MSRIESLKRTRRLGPYSKRLTRGVIGDLYDGRSTEGRFCRDLEKQLIDHIGGSPSIAQRLLIDRIVKIRLQLDMLDQKLLSPAFTDLDRRVFGALQHSFRLCLQQLGMKSIPPPEPSFNEHMRRRQTRSDEAAE
jgi:hypothetical protein